MPADPAKKDKKTYPLLNNNENSDGLPLNSPFESIIIANMIANNDIIIIVLPVNL